MSHNRIARDIAFGIAGGLVATWITDRAQRGLWEATPVSERRREPATRDGSSANAAARKLLDDAGASPTEDQVETTGTVIHYGLGLAWGPLYKLLRSRGGMTPVAAGITSGTALALVVDETLSPLLDITPPNSAYPASAHARGFLTHAIWGLAAAATVETLERLSRRRTVSRHIALKMRKPGTTLQGAGRRQSRTSVTVPQTFQEDLSLVTDRLSGS